MEKSSGVTKILEFVTQKYLLHRRQDPGFGRRGGSSGRSTHVSFANFAMPRRNVVSDAAKIKLKDNVPKIRLFAPFPLP